MMAAGSRPAAGPLTQCSPGALPWPCHHAARQHQVKSGSSKLRLLAVLRLLLARLAAEAQCKAASH